MQKIKLIVCFQKNGGIGLGSSLLYRFKELPGDKDRFVSLRENCVVIVGRITWETLQKHPLPNCINYVISTRNEFEHDDKADKVFSCLNSAIAWAKKYNPDKDIALIGGEQVYREVLPIADIVHATVVDHERPADKFFPELSPDVFSLKSYEEQQPGASGLKFAFADYERIQKDYEFFSPPQGPSGDTYKGEAD